MLVFANMKRVESPLKSELRHQSFDNGFTASILHMEGSNTYECAVLRETPNGFDVDEETAVGGVRVVRRLYLANMFLQSVADLLPDGTMRPSYDDGSAKWWER